MTVSANTANHSSETIVSNSERRSISRVTGALISAVSFVGIVAIPIGFIGYRTGQEVGHATDARTDMRNAILAFTGSRLLDTSVENEVLLQPFNDHDTNMVQTGASNPTLARQDVLAASTAIHGTYKNSTASDHLARLARQPELTADELVTGYDDIRIDITNGDMIKLSDIYEELGCFAGLAAGLSLFNATRKKD